MQYFIYPCTISSKIGRSLFTLHVKIDLGSDAIANETRYFYRSAVMEIAFLQGPTKPSGSKSLHSVMLCLFSVSKFPKFILKSAFPPNPPNSDVWPYLHWPFNMEPVLNEFIICQQFPVSFWCQLNFLVLSYCLFTFLIHVYPF